MTRLGAAIAVLWMLALPALGTGCTAPPARAEQAPGSGTAWRTLGTWSGDGSRQTDSFDVATGALRIRWETSHETTPGAGRFKVSLHSAISGRPLQTVIDARGTNSDVAHFEDDPRVSYLVIESTAVDWRVTVEEAVARQR
jgi:hypothetical protein